MELRTSKMYPDVAISEDGTKIKNMITGNMLSSYVEANGYVRVGFNKSNLSVHRLVAAAWVDNDDPTVKVEVNHDDGNKLNNNASNLEWCTQSHNMDHVYRTGLSSINIVIVVKDLQDDTIRHYQSINKVAKQFNITNGQVAVLLARTSKYPYLGRYVFHLPDESLYRLTSKYNSLPVFVRDHITKRTFNTSSFTHTAILTGISESTIAKGLRSSNAFYSGGYTFGLSRLDNITPPSTNFKEDRDRVWKASFKTTVKDFELFNYETEEVLPFKTTKEIANFLDVKPALVKNAIQNGVRLETGNILKGYGIRQNDKPWMVLTEAEYLNSKHGKRIDRPVFRYKDELVFGIDELVEKTGISKQLLRGRISNKSDFIADDVTKI